MKTILLILLIFFSESSNSSPVGKGLSCNKIADKEPNSFENFRGIFFESENSVRVVSFKNKNKSLKVISKVTPYKISQDNIEFKIKFIWYGDISFEYFNINRGNLNLAHKFQNKSHNLKCNILEGDFMSEMTNTKLKYQESFNIDLKSNKI